MHIHCDSLASRGSVVSRDTVACVQDERYAHLVGCQCEVPFSGGRCAGLLMLMPSRGTVLHARKTL